MKRVPTAFPQSAAPRIFDRGLVRSRLSRALRRGVDDFLITHATDDLRERLSTVRRDFGRVLDLGTPRPTVAAMLAETLPHAEITRAASVPEAAGAGRWRTVVADEEMLPFAGESFDLAVSILGLHAVNDLPGALVQMRRSLSPDGLFLGCLFGGQTLAELRQAMSEAEIEAFGGASPRVAPFSDLRDLGSLLQRAGYALPVTDTDILRVRYGDMFALLSDLRAMGATNALELRERRPLARRVLARAAAIYAERFTDHDGRVRATFELVWLSGWAPHESQQKPLKPGSARVSLEAALNTGATDG